MIWLDRSVISENTRRHHISAIIGAVSWKNHPKLKNIQQVSLIKEQLSTCQHFCLLSSYILVQRILRYIFPCSCQTKDLTEPSSSFEKLISIIEHIYNVTKITLHHQLIHTQGGKQGNPLPCFLSYRIWQAMKFWRILDALQPKLTNCDLHLLKLHCLEYRTLTVFLELCLAYAQYYFYGIWVVDMSFVLPGSQYGRSLSIPIDINELSRWGKMVWTDLKM